MLSLLALTLAVCFRFASAAALKNSSSLDIAVHNDIQAAAPEIDPRFTVVADYYPEKIDETGAYLIVLEYLKYEAKWDFNGDTPSYSINSAPYKLKITAGTPGQGAFPRRFLVWGLYRSIQILARDDRFTRAVFRLSFDNHHVAAISFEPFQSNFISNDTLHSPQSLSSIPNGFDDDEGDDTDLSPNPAEYIKPFFIPRGSDLSMPGIFLPLVAGMVRIAQEGIITPVGEFEEQDAEFNTLLSVTSPPRRRPPPRPLLGTSCIKAIWRIAIFIANAQVFREVTTEVRIATILYGSVAVRQLELGSDGDVANS